MKQSFRSLFCEAYGCAPDEFEQRLFQRCLYRPIVPVAWIILRVSPAFFREDLVFLREVGAATSRSEVVGELNRFYGRNIRDRNWLRKQLAIRVSAKRVLRVYRSLLRAQRSASKR
jgi:hypothetical protein